jgi:hypothetical protein
MNNSSILKKSLRFGDNEVKGWIKTIDGKKTNFEIADGEIRQWCNTTQVAEHPHPFLVGLLEMLYTAD